MNRLKRRLHDRGIHKFCRTVPMPVPMRVGTDLSRQYLTVINPQTGGVSKVDASVFGGFPIYRTVLVRVHR